MSAHRPNEMKHRICEVILPGRIDYATSVVLQESYVNAIQEGSGNEVFILLEHPHVITLGRGSHVENLLISQDLLAKNGVSVEETGRGGDVTYHGPGQIVGYPIISLADKPDLHLYLRNLEELMIRTVDDFGIHADRKPGMTGIWVGDEKIGAIGVRVVRWITTHGFALNVNTDLKYFEYIVPCGIKQFGVTSLQKILGREIPIEDVQRSLVSQFAKIFDRKMMQTEFTVKQS